MLRAVLLDVDFTLFRPGPELGADGYVRAAARHGLSIDAALYDTARLAAFDDLRHHPELEHDEEIWVRFTEDIVRGMGGTGQAATACAREIVREWENHENFLLFDDTPPFLGWLRQRGLKIALISNGQRDLIEFAEHHRLDVDVAVGSKAHGYVKPHPSIFEFALAALGHSPAESLMVGDSHNDDIGGARRLGIDAILIDREGRTPPGEDVVHTLSELPDVIERRFTLPT